MVLIQNMDFENCGIDSGSRNLLDVDQHKNVSKFNTRVYFKVCLL